MPARSEEAKVELKEAKKQLEDAKEELKEAKMELKKERTELTKAEKAKNKVERKLMEMVHADPEDTEERRGETKRDILRLEEKLHTANCDVAVLRQAFHSKLASVQSKEAVIRRLESHHRQQSVVSDPSPWHVSLNSLILQSVFILLTRHFIQVVLRICIQAIMSSSLTSFLNNYVDVIILVMLSSYEEWLGLLFTISVLIYATYYNRFQHNYISRIYQFDKYGVVLVYGIVALLRFYNDYAALSYRRRRWLHPELRPNIFSPFFHWYLVSDIEYCKSAPSWDRFRCEDFEGWTERVQQYLAFLVALRVLAFTLIFKNNTSDDDSEHKNVHLFMVGVLGVFASLTVLFKYLVHLTSGETCIVRLASAFVYLYIFNNVGKQQEQNHLPRDQQWNAMVTIYEAALIEQTL